MNPRLPPYFRLLMAAAVLTACGDDRGPAATVLTFDAATPPVVDPSRLPFPSDAYRDPAGGLRLQPRPGARAFESAQLVPTLARVGFGTQAAVHFGFDGPAPAAPLPTTQIAAAAGIVDVDPASPQFARAVTVEIAVDPRLGLISVTPALGFPLRPRTRYVAYIAADMGGSTPLRAAPAFARVRDGVPADAAETGLAASLAEPLALAARAVGRERRDIVAATVFTTQDPVADMRTMAAAVRAAPAPQPTFASLYVDDASAPAHGLAVRGPLNELYGVPQRDDAGVDNRGGVVHDRVAAVLLGTVTLQQWTDLAARAPIRRDDAGVPAVRAVTSAEIAVVLPDCATPAGGWPVVIVQHGLNGEKGVGVGLANAFAAQCLVVVAMDAYAHGARGMHPRDRVHNVSGEPGADGMGDRYNFGGLDQIFLVDPEVARDNLKETAIDLVQLADSLARADWDAALRALVNRPGYALVDTTGPLLNPTRIAYVGQSMGAIVGSLVLGISPDIAAGVLHVGGGNLMRLFTEAPAFNEFLFAVGVVAEADPTATIRRDHPALAQFQAILEGADPANYARHWFSAPIAPAPPKHVLLAIADWDQLIAQSASEGLAVAAGMPFLGEYPNRRHNFVREPIALPAGLTTDAAGGGRVAAGLVLFPESDHGVLTNRCTTIVYRTEPPWGRLPQSFPLANPTAAAQAQAARFVATALAGAPRIDAPSAGDRAAPGCL